MKGPFRSSSTLPKKFDELHLWAQPGAAPPGCSAPVRLALSSLRVHALPRAQVVVAHLYSGCSRRRSDHEVCPCPPHEQRTFPRFRRPDQPMSDRLCEIDAELKKLRKARRELLDERQRLMDERRPEVASTSEYWLEPIFSIIENHRGASRLRIQVMLDAEYDQPKITSQALTNTLTTLRRRGWIENRGTRKHPRWHSRGRIPKERWNTRESRTA